MPPVNPALLQELQRQYAGANMMSPPLTSPSHQMAQRQLPDLRRYSAPPTWGGGGGGFGNLVGGVSGPSMQMLNNMLQYGRGSSPSSPNWGNTLQEQQAASPIQDQWLTRNFQPTMPSQYAAARNLQPDVPMQQPSLGQSQLARLLQDLQRTRQPGDYAAARRQLPSGTPMQQFPSSPSAAGPSGFGSAAKSAALGAALDYSRRPGQQNQPTFQAASADQPSFGGSFGNMLSGIGRIGSAAPTSQFGSFFGQQQPRTIRTTDPGAGYGMSPSGPTAQMPDWRSQPKP